MLGRKFAVRGLYKRGNQANRSDSQIARKRATDRRERVEEVYRVKEDNNKT